MFEEQRPGTELALSQFTDISLQMAPAAGYCIRYAYSRAAETRLAGDAGQDFLAWRESCGVLAFATCDGVSQSFFGDLAARLLGSALLDWLWRLSPEPLDEATVGADLQSRLTQISCYARRMVDAHQLPPGIPILLREVLEQKREQGSDSMFAAGRIDRPTALLRQGRLILVWMGDMRLRLWQTGPDCELCEVSEARLGCREVFATDQRWSSHRGPVGGPPHVHLGSLLDEAGQQVSRLMAYSDGLAALDAVPRPLPDPEFRDLAERARARSDSDDIAFIDVDILDNGDVAASTGSPPALWLGGCDGISG